MAYQVLISRYITVAAMSVYIWEVLNNIFNDYTLLSKHRIRLPILVYFISRICSLAFIVSAAVFQTAPVNKCYQLEKSLGALFFFSVTSTSLLFFFRTRAVFDRNPWIVAFFAVLWLGVVAACVTVIVGVDGTNLDSTRYCIDGTVKPYVTTATIIPLINDTLVFFAITWRLSCNSFARPTLKDGLRVWIFGDYLPIFSKAMLQDGQAYYLTTITINLVAVIMLYNRSVPTILRTVFWLPNVIMVNMMACRVFRNTIFGKFRESEIATSIISRELRAEVVPLPLWEGDSMRRLKQGEVSFDDEGAATPKVEPQDCAVP
jgi:hypothetical protein